MATANFRIGNRIGNREETIEKWLSEEWLWGSSQGIELGEHKETRKPVCILPQTRSTHMQIIGSTGEGKSKFMEHLIREDIINNNGLCLIDPHGYLYTDLLRWCETKGMMERTRPKKIILFNPTDENWTFGFNPLQVSGAEISFHVDAMVKACAKVWGGEDQDKTPLLKRCLQMVFYVLAEKGLSLLEAQALTDPLNPTVRKYLTHEIANRYIKQQWDYINTLKPKPFYDEFGSTINRLMEFLTTPIIRNIIGQVENTIDFRKIMDEGWILLVNLSPSGNKLSDDNARLLGTLIVNDLFLKARARPKGSRPFYLFIDECGRYVNEDIGRILDEGRKFGLHLILAHQHLSQLKKAGEEVYHAIRTNTKTKVIFGGLETDDARELAEQVFLGELDLEEPKKSLNKPVVVRYIQTWLDSYSSSQSSSRGESRGSSQGRGEAVQINQQFLSDNQIITTTAQDGEARGSMGSYGESEGWSQIQAIVPILEERPTQMYSLEEQIHRAMSLMVNQPAQQAIIKLPKQHSQIVETPYVDEGIAREERVREFQERCYCMTEFAKPRTLVEEQIEERRLMLEQKAEEAVSFKRVRRRERVEDFRE